MKRRKIFIASILAVIVVAAVVASYSLFIRKPATDESASPQYTKQQVSLGSIVLETDSTGTISASTTSLVYPKKAGVVSQVLVESGKAVKKGDVIAVLARNESEVQQAEANLRQRQDGVGDAKVYLKKVKDLSAMGAATDSEIKSAESSLESAQEALETASIKLGSLVRTKADGNITAPIDGIVTSLNLTLNTNVSTTSSVATITSLDSLALKVTVDEYEVGGIAVGQQAIITLSSDDSKRLMGTVASVGKIGTSKSGVVVFDVMIKVLNADESVLPGMSADAVIIRDRADNAVIIASSLLQRMRNEYYVNVYNESGEVEARTVTVGIMTDNRAQITQGLTAGEYVAVPSSSGSAAKAGTSTTTNQNTQIPGMGGFDGQSLTGGGGRFQGGTPPQMPPNL
ncbi:MAG: Multidrug resistance protein MdtA precursor [Firmicutes bacterium ADurb.Bin153]|nr:MAG: Multidrug resistance protein MdtA precursor [Firmicutes bacterium ADurb.Bin153]